MVNGPGTDANRSFAAFSRPLRSAASLIPALFLFVLLGLPLLELLLRSLSDANGNFTGLSNFTEYLSSPSLASAFGNALFIGALTTALTVCIAFAVAYGITCTRFCGRGLFSALTLLPLCAPSIFPAMGLIYLLGTQGPLRFLLGGHSLYGPIGVTLGSVIFSLPHAVLLIASALRDIDPSLHLAAKTLKAGPARRFFTITLPGAQYGVVSAALVTFILTVTDFGVPKVLGGDYAMPATEIFQQVIGLQDFSMGSVVSLVLLAPLVPAFFLDRWAGKRQKNQSKALYRLPERHTVRDLCFSALVPLCLLPSLAACGMTMLGAVIGFWPYDLSFTLAHFSFEETVYGLAPFGNSLIIAGGAALLGTCVVFFGAYLTERTPGGAWSKALYRFLALLPLGIPGTVLGLSFVLAFNRPGSPLASLSGTLPLLVLNCVVHFYTVCHLTASGSLARMDPNYEHAGTTLGVSRFGTFFRVILPLEKDTLLDIGFYLFVNSLTTISAVVFLYGPDSMPASAAALQMLDSGQLAEASAMGVLILSAALAARAVQTFIRGRLGGNTAAD